MSKGEESKQNNFAKVLFRLHISLLAETVPLPKATHAAWRVSTPVWYSMVFSPSLLLLARNAKRTFRVALTYSPASAAEMETLEGNGNYWHMRGA